MNLKGRKLLRGNRSALLLCCLVFSLANSVLAASGKAEADTAAHTKVGDNIPTISVQKMTGDTFSSAANQGKVLVINFWATWCGPCQVEMPLLQKQIWEKYSSNPDFAFIAIAREQTQDDVAPFQKKHPQFTFPLAVDPKRSTYSLFADSGIPRSYVVDRHGKIIYQSLGYDPHNITGLDHAIKQALAQN